MTTVDRDLLPYPRQPFVITPHGPFSLPGEAIDGSSGQCQDLTIRESEGVLAFFDSHVAFYPDRSGEHRWSYEEIESFAVRRGWLLPLFRMRGLSLRVGARKLRFRIGYMQAANADYILTTVGVPRA